jgi:hypothetical protein
MARLFRISGVGVEATRLARARGSVLYSNIIVVMVV